ncbi:unnamed protein product [Cuscuta epithymum]|uniref:Uncharacterized protein n=1 Tax=Cuscuta epithymum TaxID=186058 RepID=A0AAV0C249_9ASTE|nr:unnamed protein product [Cuscuta epithymum]
MEWIMAELRIIQRSTGVTVINGDRALLAESTGRREFIREGNWEIGDGGLREAIEEGRRGAAIRVGGGGLGGVGGEAGPGEEEVGLELGHTALEGGDGANAAVDGVGEADLGLVDEGIDGVLALLLRDLVENFGDVASAEDLVDLGEFLRVVGAEVGGELAVGDALPLQQLAGGAGRA